MALLFRQRLSSIPSKKVRRDSQANFEADTLAGYEIQCTVTFLDFNDQTKPFTFDIVAADAAAAVTAVTTKLLPAFAVTDDGQLQGLQMLSYSLNIRQEIGDDGTNPVNPSPLYGHQREMHGVLVFPLDGELVEHKFPNPTQENLDPNDRKYLNFDPDAAVAPQLKAYIGLFTSATPTLQIRGKKPGAPQKGFMRHTASQVKVEATRIG